MKTKGISDKGFERIAYSLSDPYSFPSKYEGGDYDDWEALGQDILYVMDLVESRQIAPVEHENQPGIDYAYSTLSIALEELRRNNYGEAWNLYNKVIGWYDLPATSVLREERENLGWEGDVKNVYKGPMGSQPTYKDEG